MADTNRLNLSMPSSVIRLLDELKTRTEASSRTEVVKRSIALYDAVTKAKQRGDKLCFVGSDGAQKEIVIL